ncbi:MAG: dehydratase, partial [Pseudorhodoplanes sp.]|nr:dehydratase [Pseudorhodoplanes sp.]
MKYLEEFSLGERVELGSHLFTAAAIKSYALRFDPQRFHVDE